MQYVILPVMALCLAGSAYAQDEPARQEGKERPAARDVSESVKAKAIQQGNDVEISLTSAEGWNCFRPLGANSSGGTTTGSASRSGKSSGTGSGSGTNISATPVRLRCSDGAAGTAFVRRDASGDELSISLRLDNRSRGTVRALIN